MKPDLGEINLRAILFDLDGTLYDRKVAIQRAFEDWCRGHPGLDPELVFRTSHGKRVETTVKLVLPNLASDPLALDREADEIARLEMVHAAEVSAIDGAAELLAALNLHEVPWAIATSSRIDSAVSSLKQLGLPVPGVLICAGDVTEGKPDPQCYLLAARRLGVPPDCCMVLEDAPAGILAAKRAGMFCVGVVYTHEEADLRAAGADLIIPTLADLRLEFVGVGQARLITG